MPLRLATPTDVPTLVQLMAEFYAESGYEADHEQSGQVFTQLIGDPSLGRVWLIEHDDRPAGYLVLTLGFSMEYGGRDAFIDDLFLRPDARGRGLGTAALEAALAACRELDVRAVHLEVDPQNTEAHALYKKMGLSSTRRQLWSRRL